MALEAYTVKLITPVLMDDLRMDQADLDAIEARLNASTPGRWRLDNDDDSLWRDGSAWIGPEEREGGASTSSVTGTSGGRAR